MTIKRIILFDIDHTLINTDKFRNNFLDKFKKLNIKENIIKKVNTEYINKLKTTSEYSPARHLSYLKEYLSQAIIKKLDNSLFKRKELYKNILYTDVLSALPFLSRKYALGIFSEGDLDFQYTKLIKTGIKKFFKKNYFFIFKNKSERKNIYLLPSNSIIVDNDLFILKTVNNTRKDLSMILMNRNNIIYSSNKIKSINSLDLLSRSILDIDN